MEREYFIDAKNGILAEIKVRSHTENTSRIDVHNRYYLSHGFTQALLEQVAKEYQAYVPGLNYLLFMPRTAVFFENPGIRIYVNEEDVGYWLQKIEQLIKCSISPQKVLFTREEQDDLRKDLQSGNGSAFDKLLKKDTKGVRA